MAFVATVTVDVGEADHQSRVKAITTKARAFSNKSNRVLASRYTATTARAWE